MSATRLADALEERLLALAGSFFVQGVVQPLATNSYVNVDVDGSPVRCPYISTYRPRSGDVVWLAGPPGSWVCLGTISGIRDLAADLVSAVTLAVSGNATVNGTTTSARFRGPLGGPGEGYDGFGTWHGNVQGDGVSTSVTGGYIGSGGNVYGAVDINAGRSIAAALNVFDGVGNLRAPSERALKEPRGDLGDPFEVIDQLVTGRFTFTAGSGVSLPRETTEWVPRDPDDDDSELVERPALEWVPDESTHVGLYVDEIAAADPDLVRVNGDGHRTFEDRGVLAYAMRGLQWLRRDRDDLAARLEAVERQLAGSTTSDDQPE